MLREAHAGVAVDGEPARLLCVVSDRDADVPPRCVEAFARSSRADVLRIPGANDAGAPLGEAAAATAGQVAVWLSAR